MGFFSAEASDWDEAGLRVWRPGPEAVGVAEAEIGQYCDDEFAASAETLGSSKRWDASDVVWRRAPTLMPSAERTHLFARFSPCGLMQVRALMRSTM